MSHYIIGTAGHIDHGKTSLTKALTGIDTDRLKEEKERNISIELGFAPLNLPNGQMVSIIDVPGHERFIRHMVAGVGGIDYVLLVIAADEGVMPQTKEHLQILNYLGVTEGTVIVTKKDTVDDEWLSFVQEEIREFLHGSIFEGAPILTVSSKTGDGIETLKHHIQEKIAAMPSKPVVGPFRLPIDRVFHKKGAGAVVTGTIYSGKVSVGDLLELHPLQLSTRIRQVHVHGEEVDEAVAGQRAALNLGGIQLEDVHRGDIVVTPDAWTPTTRFDCKISFSPDIDFTLKQRSEVKLLIGTKELLASILLFDRKEVNAGDEIFTQLVLKEPTIVNREDRFIIRRPTPPLTLGGGWVIEAHSEKYKINASVAEHIAKKAESSLAERIKDFLLNTQALLVTGQFITEALKSDDEIIAEELSLLLSSNQITRVNGLNENYYIHSEREHHLSNSITTEVKQYHAQYPTRKGVNKAELTNKFLKQLPSKLVNVLWDHWSKDVISVTKEDVHLKNFEPYIPDKWALFAEKIENAIRQDGLTPKKWSEYRDELSVAPHIASELLPFFIHTGKLVQLDEHYFISKQTFDFAKGRLDAFYETTEALSVSDAKEIFGLSRKYIILLLEYFDKEKITLRNGDIRLYLNKND